VWLSGNGRDRLRAWLKTTSDFAPGVLSGSREVDDKLELGRLHDWQIGGLGALADWLIASCPP
jgi:hypothetical protein